MTKLQLKDKWILVTGASSGLGEEIARQLACRHGANLILLARRKEKLLSLSEELGGRVKVEVIVADLSRTGEAEKALRSFLESGQLFGAVLNAGVTYFGRHEELSWEEFEQMLQTNVISAVRLTNFLLPYFEQPEREGAILFVSSMAAVFPVPYQAAYSGTKSFILNFASALASELRNPRFSITTYLPGGIQTEMTAGEKFRELKGWLMPADQAAAEAISALIGRKLTHIPGRLNRIGSVFLQLLPKRFVMNRMSGVYAASLAKAAQLNRDRNAENTPT